MVFPWRYHENVLLIRELEEFVEDIITAGNNDCRSCLEMGRNLLVK